MNKILSTLVIAGLLSSSTAFAEDKFRVSMENGKQRIDFSLNGNDKIKLRSDATSPDWRGFFRIQLNSFSPGFDLPGMHRRTVLDDLRGAHQ